MNSLLRIRVQVIAKEAAKLAEIARSISGIGSASKGASAKASGGMKTTLMTTRQLESLQRKIGKNSMFDAMQADAKKAADRISTVNKNLREMAVLSNAKTGDRLGTQAGTLDLSKMQSAMSRVGIPMSNLKAGQAEQLRMARELARERAALARQAASAETAEGGRVRAFMKGVWQNQVAEAKALQVARTTATKAAASAEKAAGKQVEVFMKGVWQNQVAAAKGAAKAQEAALTHKANSGLRGFYKQLTDGRGFMAFARNLQWTGRQIEFNFTLPLVRAGRAAMTMFLANDKAAVRIVKVYGDVGDATTQLSQQTFTMGQSLQKVSLGSMSEAEQMSYKLGKGLRYLSDIYGIAQADINEMASSWAAAGYEGTALLKSVQANVEAVMIGDFESSEAAFTSLIQITGAYGGSVDDLKQTMANLNAIENDTAVNFADLTTAMGRAGSTAHRAGVDAETLAAHIAALVPAGASAETAGNSLKTIYSRLLAPTKQARDILKELGIAVDESSWMQLTAAQRLEKIADIYTGLSTSQQAVVDATLASRYQIDKFGRLITAIQDPLSAYHTALKAVSDEKRTMAQYDKELGTVLQSNSKSFEIAKTRIQNMMTDAIIPLIPTIISVVTAFTTMIRKFGEMDEGTKRAVLFGLVFVALLGPIIRITAAFGMLIAMFRGIWTTGVLAAKAVQVAWIGAGKLVAGPVVKLFQLMATGIVAAYRAITAAQLMTYLTNPWVLLGLAIIATGILLYVFRDEIMSFAEWVGRGLTGASNSFFEFGKGIVKSVAGALFSLPGIFARAFVAVVNVVKKAALAVYEWLQWMNPFARHSPSLVEQVSKGVDIIASKYSRLANIGSIFRRAASDFRSFTAATAAGAAGAAASERGEQRASILSVSPNAAPEVDALYVSLDAMHDQLALVTAEMEDQEAVVMQLKSAYDAANNALSSASNQLNILESVAAKIQGRYDAAKSKLQEFTSANIEGMGAAAQATFENEMAQKALRLQILKLEHEGGLSYDKIAERIAEINGEIEVLRGTMNDLQSAGAGSEVLGPLEAQFAALQAAKGALTGSGSPLSDLQKQLEELQYQAEVMDLENALKFDPLTRQIELLSSEIKEMPFDQIIAGIISSRAEMDALTPSLDAANAAVAAQQLAVDELTEARDRANAALDVEQVKLDELKGAYDAYKQQIEDIERALTDMASAAEKASAAGAAGGGMLPDGEGFEVPGFDATNSEQMIDDLLKGYEEQWNKFWGDFNMGDAFGKAWDKAIGFVKGKVGGFVTWQLGWINTVMGVVFGSFNWALGLVSGALSGVTTAGAAVVGWFEALPGNIAGYVDTAWEGIKTGWSATVGFVGEKGGEIIGWIADIPNKLAGFVGTIWDGIKNAFTATKDWIGGKITEAVELVRGIPGRMSSFVSTIWDGIKNAMSGAKDAVAGKITEAVELVRGIPGRLSEFVGTAWDGISNAFQSVKDAIGLKIDALIATVTGIRDRISAAASNMFSGFKSAFAGAINWIIRKWNGIKFTLPEINFLGVHIGGQAFQVPQIPEIQLARGGIVPAGMGGMLARIGEKNHDEAIIPLPHGWRNSDALASGGAGGGGGDRTFNFYGDLEFPNVENGSDAEDFMKNLESLVGA
ncbi:MAG: phage tail tape measure protein [Porticoccaceae bacterium]